jgi:hypothetical protein
VNAMSAMQQEATRSIWQRVGSLGLCIAGLRRNAR